jgi:hypothetical protein
VNTDFFNRHGRLRQFHLEEAEPDAITPENWVFDLRWTFTKGSTFHPVCVCHDTHIPENHATGLKHLGSSRDVTIV